MPPHDVVESFRGECPAQRVVAGFFAGAPILLTGCPDLAYGLQTRSVMPVLQPGRAAADAGHEGFSVGNGLPNCVRALCLPEQPGLSVWPGHPETAPGHPANFLVVFQRQGAIAACSTHCRAIRRCQCMASAVTTVFRRVSISSSLGTALILPDLPPTVSWPNTNLCSSAHALTRCKAERSSARS